MVGFIIITVVSVSVFLRRRKKEQTPQTNTIEIVLDVPKSLGYTFNSVKVATNNFSDDKGKGGFGNVYKACI
ncbi:putative non-specific serine/threonine protein kinase [Helianthus debilis subsp. tardiflorus]